MAKAPAELSRSFGSFACAKLLPSSAELLGARTGAVTRRWTGDLRGLARADKRGVWTATALGSVERSAERAELGTATTAESEGTVTDCIACVGAVASCGDDDLTSGDGDIDLNKAVVALADAHVGCESTVAVEPGRIGVGVARCAGATNTGCGCACKDCGALGIARVV